MTHNYKNTLITVRPELCFVVAGAFLLVTWQWVLAWIIASVVHELFHYIAIRLCRCKVWQIHIGLGGTWMKTQFPSPWTELVCALAGPVGSISLLLAAENFPRVAVCGCLHFLFNILPVYPIDGGRAIKALLDCFIPPAAVWKILAVWGYFICGFATVLCLFISIRYSLGPLPVLATGMIWLKIKKPCKQRRMRVQ